MSQLRSHLAVNNMQSPAYYAARLSEKSQRWSQAERIYLTIIRRTTTANADTYFRLGHAQFRQGKNQDAITNIEKAVSLDPAVAKWQYRLAFLYEKINNYELAVRHYDKAIALEAGRSDWAERKLGCLINLTTAFLAGSETTISHLVPQDSDKLVTQRARVLRKQGKRFQEAELLSAHIEKTPGNTSWLTSLAEAYESMGDYAQAADTYTLAASLLKESSLYFRAGHCFSKTGANTQADFNFEKAIAFDKKHNSKVLGIGIFFEAKGLWVDAASHYRDQVEQDPNNAQLRYRLGMSLDRSYKWLNAAEAYSRALSIEPMHPYWHFRLGFVLERASKFKEAKDAYRSAISFQTVQSSEWAYRLGHCLSVLGQHRSASEAFLDSCQEMLSKPINARPEQFSTTCGETNPILNQEAHNLTANTSLEYLHNLVERAHSINDWETMAEVGQRIIDSQNQFESTDFALLGYALYQMGKYEDAVNVLRLTRQQNGTHGINISQYAKDETLLTVMQYAEYLDSLPVNDKIVMFESGHGTSINCNPHAIYSQLLNDDRFNDFSFVWVSNSSENLPLNVNSSNRVTLVAKDSDLYLKYLATAGYLINNTSFPTYFTRRDNQRYLNTWHGTPIKTLGRDVKGTFFEHSNIARNILQTTHLISGNDHTNKMILEGHNIQGIYAGKIAITGYPRTDQTVLSTTDDATQIRTELGIDPEDARPIVLYAPTWRGGLTDMKFDTARLENDLRKLNSDSYHVYFRAHRFAEKIIDESDIEIKIVPPSLDSNRLLVAVDLLITDYSSIYFDFLPLKRPTIFYTYDLDDYVRDRGLYLNMDILPATRCDSIESVVENLRMNVAGQHENHAYDEALETFCPFDDGYAAKRTIEFFFHDDPSHLRDESSSRKTVIFHQSMIPNGIATSFINLMNNLDTNKFRALLLIDAKALKSDPLRMDNFQKLPNHVQVLARVGRQIFTAEEKWLNDKFTRQHGYFSREQQAILEHSYSREYSRIFGNITLHDSCEFDGYSPFWAHIFGAGGQATCSRVIYLHNQMKSEMVMKYPNLEAIFQLYPLFDKLASVSESVNQQNMADVAEVYGIPENRFVSVANPLDPEYVLNSSEGEVQQDITTWIRDSSKLLVTIGRLSPEKGQERLIDALSALVSEGLDLQLVIVGDGILKETLSDQIENLGLSERVYMTGQLSNPFPILNLADCFVLPSIHEGQGLVLLEALILGKYVISTDIPGPMSVLSNGEGILVENSTLGLVDGIRQYYHDESLPTSFNVAIYQKTSMEDFEKVFS